MALTNNQKVKAYEMWLNGVTQKKIADMLGVCQEEISRMFPKNHRASEVQGCIYPAIFNYMNEHKLSGNALAKKAHIPTSTFYSFLKGKSNASKAFIDKILSVTGLSYEEAFRIDFSDKAEQQ